jgi:hypothetical protein
MKIAVVKKITQSILPELAAKKIDTVIFCQLDTKVNYMSLSSDYKLVNAFDDTSNANWYNFELTAAKLGYLSKEVPSLFTYKGIDLLPALNKDLFWSLLIEHSLLFQIEKYKSKENTILFFGERSSFIKKLALLRKVFLNKDSSYTIQSDVFKEERTGKIAFRVNDLALLTMYGNLLETLGKQNLISFQSKTVKAPKELSAGLAKNFNENIASLPSTKKHLKMGFPTKLKLLFLKEDADFLINFVHVLGKLYNHVEEYEKLFKAGVRKIILNAGENEGEGNVVCALAKKYDAKTFNYMNGTKARDPQNMNSFFDFWFMPDIQTQELILSYCKVDKDQVPVTGHLLQEFAEKHQYGGTLDGLTNKLENKKIIALFTSKIFAGEINSVLEFLPRYLDLHPELVVLIRQHPAETAPYPLSHDRIIQLPKFTGDLSQVSLFDLLSKAAVTIAFSSTVSYQSSWFGIPSINYEVAEKSRLTFVDGEKVVHINSIEKLEKSLNGYLFEGTNSSAGRKALNTSAEMAAIMQQA